MLVKERVCLKCDSEVSVSELRCPRCGNMMKPMLKMKSDSDYKPVGTSSSKSVAPSANAFEQCVHLLKGCLHMQGRVGRLQFITSTLLLDALLAVSLIVCICVMLAAAFILPAMIATGLGSLLLIGIALAYAYSTLCLTVRRLHDMGYSGWLSLLGLVPIINGLLGLALLFMKGPRMQNAYGEDPLLSPVRMDTLGVVVVLSLVLFIATTLVLPMAAVYFDPTAFMR